MVKVRPEVFFAKDKNTLLLLEQIHCFIKELSKEGLSILAFLCNCSCSFLSLDIRQAEALQEIINQEAQLSMARDKEVPVQHSFFSNWLISSLTSWRNERGRPGN